MFTTLQLIQHELSHALARGDWERADRLQRSYFELIRAARNVSETLGRNVLEQAADLPVTDKEDELAKLEKAFAEADSSRPKLTVTEQAKPVQQTLALTSYRDWLLHNDFHHVADITQSHKGSYTWDYVPSKSKSLPSVGKYRLVMVYMFPAKGDMSELVVYVQRSQRGLNGSFCVTRDTLLRVDREVKCATNSLYSALEIVNESNPLVVYAARVVGKDEMDTLCTLAKNTARSEDIYLPPARVSKLRR